MRFGRAQKCLEERRTGESRTALPKKERSEKNLEFGGIWANRSGQFGESRAVKRRNEKMGRLGPRKNLGQRKSS